MWSIFLFDSLSVFYQNIQSELQQQRGGGAVAMATKAAAIVITRLLLHCVCVCVCVYGHSVCEFTLLSSDRRRGHPPLTLCQRGRERASESRERAWLKPHNAPHAAGLKSCRFISSCSRGCLWAHTHSYTQTEARKYTDVQAGKTALLWPHR